MWIENRFPKEEYKSLLDLHEHMAQGGGRAPSGYLKGSHTLGIITIAQRRLFLIFAYW